MTPVSDFQTMRDITARVYAELTETDPRQRAMNELKRAADHYVRVLRKLEAEPDEPYRRSELDRARVRLRRAEAAYLEAAA